MPTTYAAAVSLAESMYITPTNPHGWVPGFDKDPAKFLQDVAQPFADAGIRLEFANAFGRGGKTRTFSKRFDGKDASVTAAEWMFEGSEHCYAVSNFVKSTGLNGTFLYIGTPGLYGFSPSLAGGADRLSRFSHYFPGCIPIYDNVGDIDSSELCAGSALFAAHDAMDRVPFNSPVPWGIEPNPARKNWNLPAKYYTSICYTYGTPRTWSAVERYSIEHVANSEQIPIVAIRGDEYKTPEERLAVAREWGPRVEPYNGIVVVHRVSVEQMEGLTK